MISNIFIERPSEVDPDLDLQVPVSRDELILQLTENADFEREFLEQRSLAELDRLYRSTFLS